MPFLPTSAFPVDVLPNGNVRALAPVVWHGHHGDTVTVPAGYVSDWGSVPTLVRAVLPHDGPLCRAFLVHDVLCTALADVWRAARGQQGATPEQLALARAFTPVDVDAVLRLILAEIGDDEAAAGNRRPLGTGPARWLYWAGVRAGALGNPARRAGFLRARSVLPFLALAPVGTLALLPAAIGALVSRALVAVGELAVAPWEARARRERARAGWDVLAADLQPTVDALTAKRARGVLDPDRARLDAILARASAAPPCTCTPTSTDPGCARPAHRDKARTARQAPPGRQAPGQRLPGEGRRYRFEDNQATEETP